MRRGRSTDGHAPTLAQMLDDMRFVCSNTCKTTVFGLWRCASALVHVKTYITTAPDACIMETRVLPNPDHVRAHLYMGRRTQQGVQRRRCMDERVDKPTERRRSCTREDGHASCPWHAATGRLATLRKRQVYPFLQIVSCNAKTLMTVVKQTCPPLIRNRLSRRLRQRR